MEIDNLRTALAWSAESGAAEPGLRLAAALRSFWDIRGYWAEGRGWLEGALAHPAAQARTRARGWALAEAGMMAAWPHLDHEAARPLFEESLAIAHELGDRPLIARSLLQLGKLTCWRGEPEAERALTEASLAVSREAGSKYDTAEGLMDLAVLALGQGEFGTARALLDESLAM